MKTTENYQKAKRYLKKKGISPRMMNSIVLILQDLNASRTVTIEKMQAWGVANKTISSLEAKGYLTAINGIVYLTTKTKELLDSLNKFNPYLKA